ncbi:MAG: dicarboxylate/amino acid:cation symporter, partial [Bacteroidia bacterium]|nr:dicarboxylate/amino acid:cation symporter [Bacteroidia bacterium]
MKKFPLHWQILVALILGILYGTFLGEYTGYVDWMGDIFLRALKMIIIPLILSSIISGVTNIGTAENLGRLGLKTIVYYLSTSFLAIVTGLLFVNLLQPGVGADLGFSEQVGELGIMQQSFGQILINIIPTN